MTSHHAEVYVMYVHILSELVRTDVDKEGGGVVKKQVACLALALALTLALALYLVALA